MSNRLALPHEAVPEALAVGLEPPRRRGGEVDRQQQQSRAGDLAEEAPPRRDRLLRVPIEDRRPLRLAALQGVVEEVAGDDRALRRRSGC